MAFAYDVTVRADDDGDGSVIEFGDVTVASVNGMPAPPDMAPALAVADVAVSATGSGEEARGVDGLLAGLPAELTASPLVRQRYETVAVDTYWETWVGQWADLESMDDAELEGSFAAGQGGAPFDTTIRIVSEPVGAGRAHLVSTQKESGDALNQAVASMASIPPVTSIWPEPSPARSGPTRRPSFPTPPPTASRVTGADAAAALTETREWTFRWSEAACA